MRYSPALFSVARDRAGGHAEHQYCHGLSQARDRRHKACRQPPALLSFSRSCSCRPSAATPANGQRVLCNHTPHPSPSHSQLAGSLSWTNSNRCRHPLRRSLRSPNIGREQDRRKTQRLRHKSNQTLSGCHIVPGGRRNSRKPSEVKYKLLENGVLKFSRQKPRTVMDMYFVTSARLETLNYPMHTSCERRQ